MCSLQGDLLPGPGTSALLLLAACADPVEPSGTPYVLTFAGRPAGTEVRSRSGDRVLRTRTWVLALEGSTHRVETRTELTLQDGRAVAWTWTDGARERAWTGSGFVPEVVPPPASAVVPVVDPWAGEVAEVEVRVDGEEVRWSVGGQEARARHDADGLVAWSQGLVALERVDVVPPEAPLDLLALLRVPTEPLRVGALVGRYRVDGATVEVRAPIRLELVAEPVAAGPPEGPTVLQHEAARIVAPAADRPEAVARLVRAVAERLDGRPTPGTATALEALRSGRGDCTEHAELLVGLARAAGIPARVRGGLVYRDGAAGPGLYPHAWAEVQLGAAWIGADAALGQFPADATHLRLGDDLDGAVRRLATGADVRVVEVR